MEFLELFVILHYYHYLMTVKKPLALYVQIEPCHEETSFYRLRTTKVQISLHIYAV